MGAQFSPHLFFEVGNICIEQEHGGNMGILPS